MMECGVREFTLDEEIEIYKKEAKELFDNEQEGCEAPFANCIVRRGMRIISKSKEIREKFTPKKANYPNELQIKCPVCGRFVLDGQPYCDECGQAIDWS